MFCIFTCADGGISPSDLDTNILVICYVILFHLQSHLSIVIAAVNLTNLIMVWVIIIINIIVMD